MKQRRWLVWSSLLVAGVVSVPLLATQPPPGEQKDPGKKGFQFGPGGPGGPFQQERKLVQQFDKDGNGWLNVEERRAARDFIKKQGGPGGRFGGKGGPGGFRPGGFLTKPLLEALDTDKDGKLSREEIRAGVKQFYARVDKGKKGTLDEAQVGEGLKELLPPPPGFPGGPPFGGFRARNPLAGALVQRADANKDGKLTAQELAKAAETLFKEADKNSDGKLDESELGAAVALLAPPPGGFPGPGGFGPPGGFGGKGREPATPGPKVAPTEVKTYPKASLYDPTVLRTLFLEFENPDWEAELADFRNTDVEVPAILTVDGKKYPNVGVHFRGMSSYMMTPAGYKRSLNLSLDFIDSRQRLYGSKTLNLLNGGNDPSLLSTVLFSHIARQYIPAPKANLVKVVINGESWGIYTNAQQFNKEFLTENYRTSKGARWKIKGSPGGAGGLDYIGDNLEDYKRRYTIRSKDDAKSWQALVNLCRTLSKTPLDQLEKALEPILDIDGVLWFLALDVALQNEDGYWVRASDYSLYLDPKGKFHLIPHDMNEAFHPAMAFGGPGGRGPGGPGGGFGKPGGGPGGMGKGGAFDLDPLVALNDARKPLRSRLLQVPGLKARYLHYVRTIAEDWLSWQKLGPVVAQYRTLIEPEVKIETRRSLTFDVFARAVADAGPPRPVAGMRGGLSLRSFADQRREFLLNHPEVKKTRS